MSLPSSGSRQQGRHDMKMKCFLKKIRLQLRYHQQGAKPPISIHEQIFFLSTIFIILELYRTVEISRGGKFT